ncbi:MAG: DUF1015 domain-containing protein [Deltaproteobacteria bacterium]|nr:DUF1015 domain-containing protein [Deltaproteobacteria bacterium]
MVSVLPFRGLRPVAAKAKAVASPPYDVLNTNEARAMAAGNPISFLRVNKSELEFDDSVNPYSPEVYARGKDNLAKLRATGVLVRDPQPCFYVYRLTMGGRPQTGLVALTSCAEYDAGIIKRHEHTRPEKVSDRATHIETLGAQVGPVFCAFRDAPALEATLKTVCRGTPEYDFVADDQIRHELWVVSEPKVQQTIRDGFAKLDHIYICDGHHRSASASEVRRRLMAQNKGQSGNEAYHHFLNVIFPAADLKILPYNRVIKDLNGLSPAAVVEKAAAKFEVAKSESEPALARPHQFALYAARQWWLLTAKPQSFDASSPTASIDASIIHANLIAPILGITDPKTDKRIDFVGGIRGTKELVTRVDAGEVKLAIALFPTTLDQLFAVADAGDVMPPKSTWFEPKLRDGVVVALLDTNHL